MLKKLSLIFIFFVTIFGTNFQIAFAQSQQNDWNKVINFANNEIAVKTSNGKTIFGKLTSATASEIIVQTASKKELTNQSLTIQKSEVKKIWAANLRYGKNPGVTTAIGAGIGAGIGIALGAVLLAATGGSDETNQVLATGAVIGAGAGAGLGFLAGGRGHQKKDVLYEI